MILSLIILSIIALLGVSTMRSTTTELRIAGDAEAQNRSFQAAEAGVAAVKFFPSGEITFTTVAGAPTDIVDFSTLDPNNPLSDMGQDAPVVTVTNGAEDAKCSRVTQGSSDDLIGCATFFLRSTHTAAGVGTARNAATTALRVGASRQMIADN